MNTSREYRRVAAAALVVVLTCLMIGSQAVPAFAAAKPGKVTGVKITSAEDTMIGLSWAKASNAKKYEVAYKEASAKTWKSSKTASRKITITKLKQDKKYNFKVRGLNGSKKGAWSSMLTQKTYVRPDEVDFQTILALELTKGTIKIGWDAVKGASSYKIQMWSLDKWWYPMDEQDCDYEEVSPNQFKPLTEFTSRRKLRPNTWYAFNVFAVNYNTGKFPALMSYSSGPFFICTTTGDRVITGKREHSNGENIRAYDMSDVFRVSIDEPLIPTGVYEHTDYAGEDPVDTFYETDYMTVKGIAFPDDFQRLDYTNIEEDFAGKTYMVGDMLDGYPIQSIAVSPNTGDNGPTEDFDVTFKLTDAYSVTLTW